MKLNDRIDLFRSNRLLFFSLIAISLVIAMFYLLQERTFYSWDNAFYADQSMASAEAFRHSFSEGVHFIRASLTAEYILLYTVPLIPWIWLLGASRASYIIAVYAMYFTPFLLLASELARRIFPEEEAAAARAAAVFTVATPACWIMILRGYPDIGGAALVIAVLLLYERSEVAKHWKPLLAAGLLTGSAVLLRRGYVYSVIALYGAFAIDFAIHLGTWRLREGPRDVLRRFSHLFFMGVTTCVLVYVVAPVFVHNALSSSYRKYFAGWQETPSITLLTMVDTIGILVLLLAIAGLVLLRRVTMRGRHAARVMLWTTAVWIVVWAFHARQPAYHYPQILPLATVLGLTSLWLSVSRIKSLRVARSVKAGITGVVLMNMLAEVPITRPGMVLADSIPHYVTAAPIPPLVNPAYDEIVRLVAYLRSQAQPHDRVLVAATSQILNYESLREAQQTIYGREDQKLQFDTVPLVDALGRLPTSNLLEARFVVLARPYQYLMTPERQKVFTVLLVAFEQHWPVVNDFELLPEHFTLGQPGTEMLVYERVRPSSVAVMADTTQRINDYMAGRVTSATVILTSDLWFKKSSPFPVEITSNVNGTYNITAHPAREKQVPETILEMAPKSLEDVKISGDVHFYDERCRGAEIQAGTDSTPEVQWVSGGVFTPSQNGAHFEVHLSGVRGKTLYLKIKSTPRDPANIEFCTLLISGLQAKTP